MEEKKNNVTKEEILSDLEIISEDIFEAEVSKVDGVLILIFNNGQSFRLFLQEF